MLRNLVPEFLEIYLPQLIVTGILLFSLPILKYLARKIIRKYAQINRRVESRTRHIIHVAFVLFNLTFIVALIILWGVNPRNLFVAFSSIFAIIGVAFFAQWSLLSNITAGVIIFFTTPFHIGDYIRIHDKEENFDAEIIDIKTFQTHLRTRDGELVVYPNSLFLQKGVSKMSAQKFWEQKDGGHSDFDFKE